MRIGKAIDHSHDAGVVPPNLPKPRKTKIKYALLAAVPATVVLGAVLKAKKKTAEPENSKADSESRVAPHQSFTGPLSSAGPPLHQGRRVVRTSPRRD
jgi:hypothetical protein